jgi:hypothetical protein
MVSTRGDYRNSQGGNIMRLMWPLRAVWKRWRRGGRRASGKPVMDEAERTYRHIWRHVVASSERIYPLQRGRPTVLLLQMAKVASTSIRAALSRRGINALHTHALSPGRQHESLSHLLAAKPTSALVRREMRWHFRGVAVHALVRWYRDHKQYNRHRLKVITLTRDPVTHYPSAFIHRRARVMPAIRNWHKTARPASEQGAEEAEVLAIFLKELAGIISEGRPSSGASGCQHCLDLAAERWPAHPVLADELGALLLPLTWFDREMAPLLGVDVLASAALRQHGWIACSNDWMDVLVLKFEQLPSLVSQIQRFCGLSELALPRRNVTSAKAGAAEIATAMQSFLESPEGRACARELRTSPYGRACGYDRLP